MPRPDFNEYVENRRRDLACLTSHQMNKGFAELIYDVGDLRDWCAIQNADVFSVHWYINDNYIVTYKTVLTLVKSPA